MAAYEFQDKTEKLQNLQAFSATFLAIFIMVSFIANMFLIVTICSSYRLRNQVINYAILNLAIVNLLDTAVNMVLSLLYVAMGSWQFGQFLCQMNAFFGELVSAEMMFALVILCIDRTVCLLSVPKYKLRMTPIRTVIGIGAVWLLGLCFASPILISSVEAEVREPRYFCVIGTGVDVAYSSALLVMCYFWPIAIILFCFGVIFQRARLDRVHRRHWAPDRTSYIVDTRKFQEQLTLGKISVALFLLYLILQGPYLIMHFIGLIRNSRQLIEQYGAKLLIPYTAETGITWVKFLYPVLFPFVVFITGKDYWRKFQDLACCRKTNIVRTIVSAGTTPNGISENIAEEFYRAPESDESNVPTLIATSDGLHLRTSRFDSENYAYADNPGRGNRSRSQKTSDYDSDEESGSEDLPELPQTEMIDGNIRKTRLEVSTNFPSPTKEKSLKIAQLPPKVEKIGSEIPTLPNEIHSQKLPKIDPKEVTRAQQQRKRKRRGQSKPPPEISSNVPKPPPVNASNVPKPPPVNSSNVPKTSTVPSHVPKTSAKPNVTKSSKSLNSAETKRKIVSDTRVSKSAEHPTGRKRHAVAGSTVTPLDQVKRSNEA